MKKIANIVGARPNFMKMAPIHDGLRNSSKFEPVLIHTGQHYDKSMSKAFFEDLKMVEPDIYLGVGSGTHAEQTGAVMINLEKVLDSLNPDLVIVVGDVNSTLAAALVASKANIPIAHVEAGLRSFDRRMPEEINRLCTDALSEFLFVTEKSGQDNLIKEGIDIDKIHFVGNVMIDSLISHLEMTKTSNIIKKLSLKSGNYGLITLHRPSNVDNRANFKGILDGFEVIQKKIPLVFPIHPRAQKMVNSLGFAERIKSMNNLIVTEPMGYIDFLTLMSNSRLVFTDSGGIQEETTYLKIPCLTLRENTERPVTIEFGTNALVGSDTQKIIEESSAILNGKHVSGVIPEMWDGQTSKRIIDILSSKL